MKEKIYTIPVTDAFRVDCECCLCILEKQLEDEAVDYILGPSLMEPDHRMQTNEKGFCAKHFEMLYNKQESRLGLGLIIDTHLTEQNQKLKKLYEDGIRGMESDSRMSFVKNLSSRLSPRQTGTDKLLEQLLTELGSLEDKCAVCDKINHTMDRYMDVILYLWFKEEDFRELFNSRKGFCLKHMRELLEATRKYLDPKATAIFTSSLMQLQLANMERVQEEVNWFTKKFDYRYNDAPWKNSKDAIPRGIRKIVGNVELK
jgi:hypothetical protein